MGTYDRFQIHMKISIAHYRKEGVLHYFGNRIAYEWNKLPPTIITTVAYQHLQID